MTRRVLFVVGQLATGGHVRAALTYAAELRCRGWEVTFCGSDSGGGALVEEKGFPLIDVQLVVQGEFFPTRSARRKAMGIAPDVVHSFDLASVPFAAAVARGVGAKLVHTICGGKAPWYPLPCWEGLVVMSEELATAVERRTGRNPRVIRGRIRLEERVSPMSRAALRSRFAYGGADPVVLMISRIGSTKMGSLRAFADVVALLAEGDSARAWRGLICGSADDALLAQELEALCSRVNRAAGRPVLAWDTTFARHAFHVIPVADVFLGVGDAFVEAVANGVPALVMGEAGFAGALAEDTEATLYRFNLSGRNVTALESPSRTAERVKALVDDQGLRERTVKFALESVARHIGVGAAVAEYEALYETIPVDAKPQRLRLAALTALFWIRRQYLTRVPAAVRMVVLKMRGLA